MLVLHDALPDLGGQTCEALLAQAYYYRGQRVSDAAVLFLKVADGGWHRFFIDAGVVFWQLVDELDSPDFDRHYYVRTDLAAAHGLAGKRLLGIETIDLPSGGELHVRFADAPTLIVRQAGDRSHVEVTSRASPAR